MKAKVKASAQKEIKEMARRIVERFHPDKIILFGSHARGTAGTDSDVDLLVVMNAARSNREMAVAIGVELKDIRLPKDIIVVRPEAFEWRRNVVGTLEWPAAREGKVLYARP